MARPLRIEYPSAYYHVMNRGLNKMGSLLDFAPVVAAEPSPSLKKWVKTALGSLATDFSKSAWPMVYWTGGERQALFFSPLALRFRNPRSSLGSLLYFAPLSES